MADEDRGQAGRMGGHEVRATVATLLLCIFSFGAMDPVKGASSVTGANWEVMNGEGISGTNGSINSVAYSDGFFLIGGSFNRVGAIQVRNIARWDGSRWDSLGAGLEEPVEKICCDGNGKIYAAVSRSTGGVLLTEWNGTVWKTFGALAREGRPCQVSSMFCDRRGNIIIGGSFDRVDSMDAPNIAMWNGRQWDSPKSGLLITSVDALAGDRTGILYAAGSAMISPEVGGRIVQKWENGAWSTLGSGPSVKIQGSIYTLACDRSGNLYAGGVFDSIVSGVPGSGIARWNGERWSALDGGVEKFAIDYMGSVNSLAFDTTGNLYLCGRFKSVGGVSALNMAKWDGTTWSALGTCITVNSQLAVGDGGELFAATGWTFSGSEFQVAQWDGGKWSPAGKGINGKVQSLVVDGQGDLYCGGTFSTIHGIMADHIVGWNGNGWSALGTGTDSTVVTLACDSHGNLFAGGYFDTAGGEPAGHIAQWDGTRWSRLGSGVNGAVLTLATDTAGNLFAGGMFDSAGGKPAKFVAQWDGAVWSPLGSGMNAVVNLLQTDGSGILYAGGDFRDHHAAWDGSAWSEMGKGFDSSVSDFAVDRSGNLFTAADGYIKAYTKKGDQWNTFSIEGMVGDVVRPLRFDEAANFIVDTGGTLYFTTGWGTCRIVRWDGARLDTLGDRTDGPISALALSGRNLFAGGAFMQAGSSLSTGIARLHLDGKEHVSFTSGHDAASGSIRFRFVHSKLTVAHLAPGDRLSLYSISGVLLGEVSATSTLDCGDIAPQPVIVRISRAGKAVATGMVVVQK